jgi:hypothetical protein
MLVAASGCQDSVVINVSSVEDEARSRRVYGVIQEFVGQTLTVVSAEEIPTSAQVTAQNKDFIYFGEVLSCVPALGAKWALDVRVKRRILLV